MSDGESYLWSEVPVGPLGLFARGVRSTDGTPVIARSLPSATRSEATSRLLADAEWSTHLGPEVAIQPLNLPADEDPPRLILAPAGFLPLSARPSARMLIEETLRLGRAAAVALARLHARGFVHGALSPQSLWVDPDLRNARLAALDLSFNDVGAFNDDGTAQRQPQPEQRHDLRYLAPELSTPGSQADRRADLYALGVLLYEALSGRVPFSPGDSVAIHHAHSAIQAQPLDQLRPEVPALLSELVATLLAKDPEQRYQSASGLRLDLERILAGFSAQHDPADVLVGRKLRDRPSRPDKLFGRERETHALRGLFSHNGEGTLGLVGGSSGSGKSFLVDQIATELGDNWLIGRGNCGEIGDEPFAALRTALESVLAQIEELDEDDQASFAQAATTALAATGTALRQILPGIGRYLDASGPLLRLSPQAGERRVHAAFHSLLGILASVGKPIAIILDDIQWADPATIAVLRSIALTPTALPLTLLFLLRSDEVEEGTDLADTITALASHSALGANLKIEPLTDGDVRTLVADCLDADNSIDNSINSSTITQLAAIIGEHSRGNPLFAVEELQELWRGGSLRRDAESGVWNWDRHHASVVPYSKKLSELIALRLYTVPERTRELLARAACFGRQFDASSLAAVAGIALDDVQRGLMPAVRDGLLITTASRGSEDGLAFGHDQIRSAAYEMLDGDAKRRTHANIGKLLLRAGEDAAEGLPEAIAHLNAAASLLREDGRQEWLVRRNLDAARLAADKAAFRDAYSYLLVALGMLDEGAWHEHYDLTRDLHLEAARAACLSSAAASALPLLETVRRSARSTTDEASALQVSIEALKILDRFGDAVNAGLEALAKLGIEIPSTPAKFGPVARLLATHWRIRRFGVENLAGLPAMTDARSRAAMSILGEIATPAFLVARPLFPALVDAQLRLSMEFGNAPESANAYALYAVILAGPLMRIAQAHDVGVAALQVLKSADRSHVPRTTLAVYGFVMPWSIPITDCLPVYLEGSKAALEVGDPEFANYHASTYSVFSVHAGLPLDALCRELERLRAAVEPLGQQRQYAANIYHQFCLNLQSGEGDPGQLAGPIYNEETDGARHIDAAEMNGHLYLVKLMLAVIFERFDDLDVLLRGFRATIRAFDGLYLQAAFLLYEALALLRSDGGIAAQLQAETTLARLRQWKRHAPANFEHKAVLLRAELARVRGRLRRAQVLFEDAATGAEQSGFMLEAGLALEGAALVANARGLPPLSSHFVNEARRVYAQWGAVAKVRELLIRFGPASANSRSSTVGENAGPRWDVAPATLDLIGVLEASQALSAGMELDTTIRKIMQTVVELSGAQRGVLLDENGNGFTVLALGETVGSSLRVDIFSDPSAAQTPEPRDAIAVGAQTTGPFALSIVAEVLRSGSPLILSDPALDPRFRDDAYLRNHRPRALLCCPISHGNKRTAILYLEHQLRRDAFGERQLETVKLLSTQAAISLDNARLYARQLRLSAGAQRFVPQEFLMMLGKGEVDDVVLNDHVKSEMTILVCDIRGFTTATETMTPEANFTFINGFFAIVGPTVRNNLGFVIKYMGDGLMAVFPRSADDAAAAALAIPEALLAMPQFKVGVGLHTGSVAVGAVGELSRIQADVMSDVVTVACRLESLTREYQVDVVLSAATRDRLSEEWQTRTQPLGRTGVKGRVGAIDIYTLE